MTYPPPEFLSPDRAWVIALIESEPFGVLVSSADVPLATHLPFVLLSHGDDGLLLGTHMARRNPQWHGLDDAPVLAVFQGPHAYVSPRWYVDPPHNVPTWNYVAVHCEGRSRIATPQRAALILESTVHLMEHDEGWRIASADAEYVNALKRAIVAIEIQVTNAIGVRKLSQNHTREDRAGVIEALAHSERSGDRALAMEMQRELEGR